MTNEQKKSQQIQKDKAATSSVSRKSYTPAYLTDLGDVRDITLGGSPGLGDSGADFSEEPP